MRTTIYPTTLRRAARTPLLVSALLTLLLTSLAACGGTTPAGSGAPGTPLIAQDMNGTRLTLPAQPPQRIISLSPTSSEVLAAVGVEARVIAVDALTDYPASMAAKPKVSGANGAPNVEQILALKPDLVLSYGGYSPKADAQLLAANVRVVELPVSTLATSLTEMRLVGQLVHAEKAANQLVASLEARIAAVRQKAASEAPVRVYMEAGYSPAPPYAFGGGEFGDELLTAAGGKNIFGTDTSNAGFPAVSDERIIAADPQVVLLTEGVEYGGDPKTAGIRPGWSVISAVRTGRVYALDSNLVQRPGPRIADGLEQIARYLHPTLFT